MPNLIESITPLPEAPVVRVGLRGEIEARPRAHQPISDTWR
jgi:hypothetical protein